MCNHTWSSEGLILLVDHYLRYMSRRHGKFLLCLLCHPKLTLEDIALFSNMTNNEALHHANHLKRYKFITEAEGQYEILNDFRDVDLTFIDMFLDQKKQQVINEANNKVRKEAKLAASKMSRKNKKAAALAAQETKQ